MARAVSYETFCRWAERIVEALPEPLLAELSGGIQIDRAARRRDDDPPGVYLLGEYIVDPYLGRLIVIYYGSFRRLFAGEDEELWHQELEETILHELRHHVEDLAGVDWLGAEDRAELLRLWQEVQAASASERERQQAPERSPRHDGSP
ncbi:MAG TPA: metallopeptidase family protein [Bacillota bacterium]